MVCVVLVASGTESSEFYAFETDLEAYFSEIEF